MPTRLILASGSSFKRDQLARLGLEFDAIDADIDESSHPNEAPDALSRRLARQKAEYVHATAPDAFVLGGDQVISFQGTQLHKPRTKENAIAQLSMMQGAAHDLFCSVALCTPTGKVFEETVHVRMHMRALHNAQIERYVNEDDVLHSAGSYTIEAGGIRLFTSMQGDDYTAIIGLPLTRVMTMLEQARAPFLLHA